MPTLLLHRDTRFERVREVLADLGFAIAELRPSVFPARSEPSCVCFTQPGGDTVVFRYRVDPDRRFLELSHDDDELREVLAHRLGFASRDEVLTALSSDDEARVFSAAFELVALDGSGAVAALESRLLEAPGEHAEHGIVRALEELDGPAVSAALRRLDVDPGLRPQSRLLVRLALAGRRFS